MAKPKEYMRQYRAKKKSAMSPGMSAEEAMQKTNPHYGEKYPGTQSNDVRWASNCQRVVYAYEMNRRGVICEAKPRPAIGNRKVPDDYMSFWGWEHVMVDQEWTSPGELGRTRNQVAIALQQKVRSWGDGARGVVNVEWSGGRNGHLFNVENIGGEVVYIDAQSHNRIDITGYLAKAKPTKTTVSRIDNLLPDAKYIEECITRR